MELLGREYVIEHCISALNFDREREKERKTYEMYVTDALMSIAENTTHHISLGGVEDIGTVLTGRWIDILEPSQIVPHEEDNRPCEEITKDIFARIRGEHNECI